ncbi:MAG: ABC transporter ATP-binding protein [Candidatus Rokubacteria bacterium GWC2_70_16]|nr:MAG: ABC transporter ATP-binding protein [Candidatus Rokubacteria bacterium GWC2_70_16]
MTPFLVVEDLTKTFGGLRAVDHCSLEVREGTITGLIGPNGAGKTTLFNLLTGFHRPDGGRARFRGDDITGLPPHTIFRRGICRTFQIPREFKDLSVLENLMVVPPDQAGERLWVPWLLPGRVRRDEARLRDRALSVLEQVGLARLAGEPAWTLSGGQKKLLELARTLMAEPALLMLDEPGAGVNPTQMKELTRYIRWLAAERGVTILLIEHDMDLVMAICNPVIVLSEGRPLAEGPPEIIRQDPRVLSAYLGARHA